MKIEPAGHRVIVKPDPFNEDEFELKRKSEAFGNATELMGKGFEIIDGEKIDKKRLESSVQIGTLHAVGMNAWKAFDDGEPWAKVGDRVYFTRGAGFYVEENGEKLRCMNDQDIVCVIRDLTPIGGDA